MKDKKISYLKFKSVPKAQKEELIQWIIRYCDLFKFFNNPSLFLKRVKMETSEEIVGRKLFLREDDDNINKYFYIIKRGNAFSWFRFNETGDSREKGLTEKTTTEVQEKGIIGEIFCEGDFLYPGLELFENPFLAITKKVDYLQYFTPKKGHILSAIPFDKYVDPLVLIKIGIGEFDNLIFGKELLARIAKMFLHYLYLKLIANRWKLWGQWTNDTELKILSILYLYFIGELPLQHWITIEGEEIDNRGVSFKRPKCPLKEFEVGITDLALFIGVSRQLITPYLSKGKNICARDEKLGSLLQCKYVPREDLKLSSPSTLELLSYIESKVLSPAINKYH